MGAQRVAHVRLRAPLQLRVKNASRAHARRFFASAAQLGTDAAAPSLHSAAVQVSEHPDGMPHIRSTIATMAELARRGAHSYEIRNLATRIVADVPSKQTGWELAALYKWVRDQIRYRFDPVGLEWLQSPARTVQERAGDCDDLTTLLAALCMALGHEVRFITVGPSPNVQKHIALQAFDTLGRQWVTLDPVQEPPQPSTAPRADLGAFGRWPRGRASRVWSVSDGGEMLGSVTTRRDRELWLWSPLFPPPGLVRTQSSNQAPIAHGSAVVTPTYRSGNAPGFRNGRPLATQHLSRQLSSPEAVHLSGLAAARGATRVIALPVGLGYDGMQYQLGSIWGVLKKVGKRIGKIGKGALHVAGKGLKVVGKVAGGKAVGGALKQIPVVGKVFAAGAKQYSTIARVGGGALAKATKHKHGAKPKPTAWNRPNKKLGDKWRKHYPHAQQVYDAHHGVFRIYTPAARGPAAHKRGKHGALHGFRPAISFSLGADESSASLAPLAQNAITAVKAFIKKAGQPPQVKIAAVTQFQQGDGQLKVDGLYGPNVRAAAAYYLGVSAASLPAVAKPFAGTRVTWRPPAPTAAVLTPEPTAAAPAPAVAYVPVASPAPAAAAPAQHTVTTPTGGKIVQLAPIRISPSTPTLPAAPLPGLNEVGHETQNPGLPPVAATPATVSTPAAVQSQSAAAATSPSSQRVTGAPPLPSALRLPSAAAAAAFSPAPPDLQPPSQHDLDTAMFAQLVPNAPAPLVPVNGAAMPPPPIAPGQSYADWAAQQASGEGAPSSSGPSRNTLLWVAIGYLYFRQRRGASAAA